MSTVFHDKIYVKDTQNADNNDKVTAISSQGEIKETTISVSDLGSVPTLQQVTTEGNTTTNAVTISNNLQANNVTAPTGQVQGKILKAAGDSPLIQINDTDVGGANIELRPHTGTYNIDVTTPTEDGQLSLNTTSETKTISGTGDKIVLNGVQSVGDENSIYFNNSVGSKFRITNNVYQDGFVTASELRISNDDGSQKDVITISRNKVDVNAELTVNNTVVSLNYTINTSVPQTSSTLNSSFPSAIIGSKVVNQDSTERYTYTKVSTTAWRRSELMTDI